MTKLQLLMEKLGRNYIFILLKSGLNCSSAAPTHASLISSMSSMVASLGTFQMGVRMQALRAHGSTRHQHRVYCVSDPRGYCTSFTAGVP